MMSDCQGDMIEFWLSWVIVILCFLAYECTGVFLKKIMNVQVLGG
jgi:hypothetical protein